MYFRNLTTFMSSSNQKLWDERGSNGRPYIILVDKKTDQNSVQESLPVLVLKEKLKEVRVLLSCVSMSNEITVSAGKVNS